MWQKLTEDEVIAILTALHHFYDGLLEYGLKDADDYIELFEKLKNCDIGFREVLRNDS